jgi:putative acetyltransferase
MAQRSAMEDCVVCEDDPVGPTARFLIEALCAEMSARYGQPPSPFSSAESATPRSIFLVVRSAGEPLGCAALRPFHEQTGEIKRIYVAPAGRRRGIARRLLAELELRARNFGYSTLLLETGIRQPEAQRLYESCGYTRIPAFGPYSDNPTSVCYSKNMAGLPHRAFGGRQN